MKFYRPETFNFSQDAHYSVYVQKETCTESVAQIEKKVQFAIQQENNKRGTKYAIKGPKTN